MDQIILKAMSGIKFLLKTTLVAIAMYTATSAEMVVSDSVSISDKLAESYSKIKSYSTQFSSNDYSGKIEFKNPDKYFVKDDVFEVIINGDTTYKINEGMEQVIISKTDNSYALFSPKGLVSTLKNNFIYDSYSGEKDAYIFKSSDRYAAIAAIELSLSSDLLPKKVRVIINDGTETLYKFKNSSINKEMDDAVFQYKKNPNFEEIDVR